MKQVVWPLPRCDAEHCNASGDQYNQGLTSGEEEEGGELGKSSLSKAMVCSALLRRHRLLLLACSSSGTESMCAACLKADCTLLLMLAFRPSLFLPSPAPLLLVLLSLLSSLTLSLLLRPLVLGWGSGGVSWWAMDWARSEMGPRESEGMPLLSPTCHAISSYD